VTSRVTKERAFLGQLSVVIIS